MFRPLPAPAALATAFAAALTLAPGSSVAYAQTVDEIVAKNLAAKGGVDKLKAMTSVRITGKIAMQGMELPMTTVAKRPNMMRREMQFQGSNLVLAYDGTTVWTINPMTGSQAPQALTGAQADMAREDADFDSVLIDYKSKGHTVELVGSEKIAEKPAYHLKITKKNGQIQHLYIDADTNLERRTVTTVEQGGMKAEITADLSDYQQVDGITVPFAIVQSMNGNQVAQLSIDKVEFNVAIDDTIFKMPKGPSPRL